MNSFKLKILACFTMFLDHLGRLFSPAIYPLIYIGRLAFPIFAFQASLGFSYTKNIKKYITRLLIFALIAQIPFSLYFNTSDLNVLFTLLLGILGIWAYEKLAAKDLHVLGFLTVALFGFLAELFSTDYGCYGVFIIFLFHIAKNNKILITIGYSILTTITYLNLIIVHGYHVEFIWQLVFALFAIIPILFYNGKQGKKVKYIIYIFYPLHILLLYLVKIFIM